MFINLIKIYKSFENENFKGYSTACSNIDCFCIM